MTLQTWSVRRVTQAQQLQQPLRILLMLASGLDPAPPDARNGDKTRGGQNRLDIMAKGDKFVHRRQRLNRPGEDTQVGGKTGPTDVVTSRAVVHTSGPTSQRGGRGQDDIRRYKPRTYDHPDEVRDLQSSRDSGQGSPNQQALLN